MIAKLNFRNKYLCYIELRSCHVWEVMLMEKIFDINNSKMSTLEAVINGMYEMTSREGKLYTSLIDDVGDERYPGYLVCDMDMDYWNSEKEFLADDLRGIVEIICDFEGPVEEADSLIENCVFNNYFEDYARIGAMRIARLCELEAPDFIIENECAKFAYYWVLNRFCSKFSVRVLLTKKDYEDMFKF